MSTPSPQNQPYASTSDVGTPNAIIESTVTPVQAEPLGSEAPATPDIPPDRRLSWLAWAAALILFLFSRKLGMLFIVILLVFKQYPRLDLKSLLGKRNTAPRKNRS